MELLIALLLFLLQPIEGHDSSNRPIEKSMVVKDAYEDEASSSWDVDDEEKPIIKKFP